MDESPPLLPVPVVASLSHLAQQPAAARLLAAFLAGRSPSTLRSYSGDLKDFAAFLGVPDGDAAAAVLLAHGAGAANELALRYKADMQGRGLAPNTVNRRLAVLRSLCKVGRTIGVI